MQMNQILMTWNPGPANEGTWDPISSQSPSWCPWWQASSRLSAPSSEDDEEEIERADDRWHHTEKSSWPEYFSRPSSSMRTTQRQPGASDGHQHAQHCQCCHWQWAIQRDMEMDRGWGRTA